MLTQTISAVVKQLTGLLKSMCMKWKRKKIIRLILTLDILEHSVNMKSEFVQDKVINK